MSRVYVDLMNFIENLKIILIMDYEDIIDRVIEYQNDKAKHQLTCGNNSDHTPLIPMLIGEKVVLVCIDCDYQQENIPDIIFK